VLGLGVIEDGCDWRKSVSDLAIGDAGAKTETGNFTTEPSLTSHTDFRIELQFYCPSRWPSIRIYGITKKPTDSS